MTPRPHQRITRVRRHFGSIIPFALLAMLALFLVAADVYGLLAAANRHFADGKYEDALKGYDEALKNADEATRPEILHNQAATNFKLGKLQDAREIWLRVASSRDARFEAAARYNIGNCDYAEALRMASNESGQVDANQLTELLERAKRQYLDALSLDPQLNNARANIELAEQLLKQIREQATTQPASQQTSQNSPSSQQNQSSQPSSQPQQSDQQDQSQSTSQPSSTQSNAQQDQSQSTTQPSSQPQDQPQTEDSDQNEQRPESQPADQPEPESTTQPAESQPASQPESQPSAGENSDSKQPSQRPDLTMTPAEAERLLQKIRDAERQRRLKLLQRERARQRPVDKDW